MVAQTLPIDNQLNQDYLSAMEGARARDNAANAPPPPPAAGSTIRETGRDPVAFMLGSLNTQQREQVEQTAGAMSPEEAKAYLETLAANWTQMGEDANADMSRADSLRQKAPQGRETRGIYQAANPLAHIGTAINNYKRQGEYDTALGQRGEARQGAADVRERAMEDLISSRGIELRKR